ncbi:hypothetical protein L596_019672 [Steinernema carpocapsae]|uniref:Uncharacterized protein n=1 Tax=Steinernema carpocapsae TaxID=34508 RepID=A0A4U5MR83_STECR|nr:hypothetical protein L596_019672 [Steinernema carpocapsae]
MYLVCSIDAFCAWRFIKGVYHTPECPEKFRDKLPFLGRTNPFPGVIHIRREERFNEVFLREIGRHKAFYTHELHRDHKFQDLPVELKTVWEQIMAKICEKFPDAISENVFKIWNDIRTNYNTCMCDPPYAKLASFLNGVPDVAIRLSIGSCCYGAVVPGEGNMEFPCQHIPPPPISRKRRQSVSIITLSPDSSPEPQRRAVDNEVMDVNVVTPSVIPGLGLSRTPILLETNVQTSSTLQFPAADSMANGATSLRNAVWQIVGQEPEECVAVLEICSPDPPVDKSPDSASELMELINKPVSPVREPLAEQEPEDEPMPAVEEDVNPSPSPDQLEHSSSESSFSHSPLSQPGEDIVDPAPLEPTVNAEKRSVASASDKNVAVVGQESPNGALGVVPFCDSNAAETEMDISNEAPDEDDSEHPTNATDLASNVFVASAPDENVAIVSQESLDRSSGSEHPTDACTPDFDNLHITEGHLVQAPYNASGFFNKASNEAEMDLTDISVSVSSDSILTAQPVEASAPASDGVNEAEIDPVVPLTPVLEDDQLFQVSSHVVQEAEMDLDNADSTPSESTFAELAPLVAAQEPEFSPPEASTSQDDNQPSYSQAPQEPAFSCNLENSADAPRSSQSFPTDKSLNHDTSEPSQEFQDVKEEPTTFGALLDASTKQFHPPPQGEAWELPGLPSKYVVWSEGNQTELPVDAFRSRYGQAALQVVFEEISRERQFYETKLKHVYEPADLPEEVIPIWDAIAEKIKRRAPRVRKPKRGIYKNGVLEHYSFAAWCSIRKPYFSKTARRAEWIGKLPFLDYMEQQAQEKDVKIVPEPEALNASTTAELLPWGASEQAGSTTQESDLNLAEQPEATDTYSGPPSSSERTSFDDQANVLAENPFEPPHVPQDEDMDLYSASDQAETFVEATVASDPAPLGVVESTTETAQPDKDSQDQELENNVNIENNWSPEAPNPILDSDPIEDLKKWTLNHMLDDIFHDCIEDIYAEYEHPFEQESMDTTSDNCLNIITTRNYTTTPAQIQDQQLPETQTFLDEASSSASEHNISTGSITSNCEHPQITEPMDIPENDLLSFVTTDPALHHVHDEAMDTCIKEEPSTSQSRRLRKLRRLPKLPRSSLAYSPPPPNIFAKMFGDKGEDIFANAMKRHPEIYFLSLKEYKKAEQCPEKWQKVWKKFIEARLKELPGATEAMLFSYWRNIRRTYNNKQCSKSAFGKFPYLDVFKNKPGGPCVRFNRMFLANFVEKGASAEAIEVIASCCSLDASKFVCRTSPQASFYGSALGSLLAENPEPTSSHEASPVEPVFGTSQDQMTPPTRRYKNTVDFFEEKYGEDALKCIFASVSQHEVVYKCSFYTMKSVSDLTGLIKVAWDQIYAEVADKYPHVPEAIAFRVWASIKKNYFHPLHYNKKWRGRPELQFLHRLRPDLHIPPSTVMPVTSVEEELTSGELYPQLGPQDLLPSTSAEFRPVAAGASTLRPSISVLQPLQGPSALEQPTVYKLQPMFNVEEYEPVFTPVDPCLAKLEQTLTFEYLHSKEVLKYFFQCISKCPAFLAIQNLENLSDLQGRAKEEWTNVMMNMQTRVGPDEEEVEEELAFDAWKEVRKNYGHCKFASKPWAVTLNFLGVLPAPGPAVMTPLSEPQVAEPLDLRFQESQDIASPNNDSSREASSELFIAESPEFQEPPTGHLDPAQIISAALGLGSTSTAPESSSPVSFNNPNRGAQFDFENKYGKNVLEDLISEISKERLFFSTSIKQLQSMSGEVKEAWKRIWESFKGRHVHVEEDDALRVWACLRRKKFVKKDIQLNYNLDFLNDLCRKTSRNTGEQHCEDLYATTSGISTNDVLMQISGAGASIPEELKALDDGVDIENDLEPPMTESVIKSKPGRKTDIDSFAMAYSMDAANLLLKEISMEKVFYSYELIGLTKLDLLYGEEQLDLSTRERRDLVILAWEKIIRAVQQVYPNVNEMEAYKAWFSLYNTATSKLRKSRWSKQIAFYQNYKDAVNRRIQLPQPPARHLTLDDVFQAVIDGHQNDGEQIEETGVLQQGMDFEMPEDVVEEPARFRLKEAEIKVILEKIAEHEEFFEESLIDVSGIGDLAQKKLRVWRRIIKKVWSQLPEVKEDVAFKFWLSVRKNYFDLDSEDQWHGKIWFLNEWHVQRTVEAQPGHSSSGQPTSSTNTALFETLYGSEALSFLLDEISKHEDFYSKEIDESSSSLSLKDLYKTSWMNIMREVKRRYPRVDHFIALTTWTSVRNNYFGPVGVSPKWAQKILFLNEWQQKSRSNSKRSSDDSGSSAPVSQPQLTQADIQTIELSRRVQDTDTFRNQLKTVYLNIHKVKDNELHLCQLRRKIIQIIGEFLDEAEGKNNSQIL